MAGNPIESFDAISEVGKLTNLRQVCFKCEHFGSCPVTEVSSYKSYILSTITCRDKLVKLDTERIDQSEFQHAQNEFMEQIMKLQESLQDIENEHRHQLFIIDSKEKENQEHLKQMQSQILHEIDNLKHEVQEGRNKIQNEHDRQKLIRQEAIDQLKNDYYLLREQVDKKLTKIEQVEESNQVMYERRCQSEIQRLNFEKSINLALIDVLYESQGHTIFNDIGNCDTVEFKFYRDLVETHSSQETLVLHGAAHMNLKMQDKAQLKKKPTQQQLNNQQKQQQLQQQYETVLELNKVFQVNEKKQVGKFSGNNHRYYMSVRDHQHLKDLLQGKVQTFKIHKQANKCFDMSQDKENQPMSINQAVVVLKLQSDLYSKHQNEINMIQYVEQSRDLSLILIEAVLVLTCHPITTSLDHTLQSLKPIDSLLVNLISQYTVDIDSRVAQFESAAYQNYLECEKRIWAEMDSQQMLLYQNQHQEISKLRDEAWSIQHQIDKERQSQEKILRDLRTSLI